MKIKLTFILLILNICYFNHQIFAQNCDQKLEQAEDIYNNGVLSEIDILIQTCINEGKFNKEQKVRALILLINTELVRDNLALADKYTLLLYKENPLYKPNLTDSPEYTYHINRFRSTPIFRIGLSTGINIVRKNFISVNNVDIDALNVNKWSPKIAFNLGLDFYIILHRNVEIKLGIDYLRQTLEYNNGLKFNNIGQTRNFSDNPQSFRFDFTNLFTQETLIGLKLPVEIYYTFDLTRRTKLNSGESTHYKPVFYFGYAYNAFVGNNFQKIRTVTDFEGNTQRSITDGTSNLVKEGLRLNGYGSAHFGLGIRLEKGSSVFQSLISIQRGTTNLKNPNIDLVSNSEARNLAYTFGYLEDDFTVSGFEIKLSYLRSLYKPKKLFK